ncbi:MAG: hypothetical protein AAGC93_16600 [Cyanobacteria bacterium P01_F01_bin.53]
MASAYFPVMGHYPWATISDEKSGFPTVPPQTAPHATRFPLPSVCAPSHPLAHLRQPQGFEHLTLGLTQRSAHPTAQYTDSVV